MPKVNIRADVFNKATSSTAGSVNPKMVSSPADMIPTQNNANLQSDYFPSWSMSLPGNNNMIPFPEPPNPMPPTPVAQPPEEQHYNAGTYNFNGYQNLNISVNSAMQLHAFMTNYDASIRLQEAKIKSEMRMVEDSQKLQARLEYNERRKENDLIRSLKVYMGPNNVPMVESMLKGENHGTCVEVISVRGYKSKIYVSTGKIPIKILEVTWDDCNDSIKIILGKDFSANEKLLMFMLKERGVQVVCPRGIRKAALEGLYSETLRTADMIKIPYRHGWNIQKDGSLHYVYKNEITIQEVCKDARRNK